MKEENQNHSDLNLEQRLHNYYQLYFEHLSTSMQHPSAPPTTSSIADTVMVRIMQQGTVQDISAASATRQAWTNNMKSRHFYQPKTWHKAFNSIAAALFIVLLVGSLIIVLNQAHLGKIGNKGNVALQTHHVGRWYSLQMINATTGWAQTASGAILRTTDGGIHWKIVLTCIPFEGSFKGSGFERCNSSFYAASAALVIKAEPDNTTKIFHTSDGGQTWHTAVVNARAINTIYSIACADVQHCWFLATDQFPGFDPTFPSMGKEIALFRSGDGGSTWQKISSGMATSQLNVSSDGRGTAPLYSDGMLKFLNATTGWIAGTTYYNANPSPASSSISSFSWLYVTHDGGYTWQQVHLILSSQVVVIEPPEFFTQQDGVLLFKIEKKKSTNPADMSTEINITHDGGNTWTKAASIPFNADPDFLDLNHAWATNYSGDRTTYVTNDGWHHWAKIQMKSAFKQVSGYNFASTKVGWALGTNLENPLLRTRDEDHAVSLLKTTDSGQTWQKVTYSIV